MPVSHDNVTRETTRIPRVAFQGALGAFSELAIQQHWPRGATPVPNDSFEGALQCVLSRKADFAVIPIQNAIAGPVHAALQSLDAVEARIVRHAEIPVNVHLCLMAPPGSSLDALRVIRSHPMALAQCRIFCARHGWLEPQAHEDTAGAAREVAALGDLTIGAIAAQAAAQRYGLEILVRSIEDVPANWTRFVVVSER
ncbi:MAG: prephenate dehydratase domain-containing protein [Gemmatimonas sp.]